MMSTYITSLDVDSCLGLSHFFPVDWPFYSSLCFDDHLISSPWPLFLWKTRNNYIGSMPTIYQGRFVKWNLLYGCYLFRRQLIWRTEVDWPHVFIRWCILVIGLLSFFVLKFACILIVIIVSNNYGQELSSLGGETEIVSVNIGRCMGVGGCMDGKWKELYGGGKFYLTSISSLLYACLLLRLVIQSDLG